MVDQRIPLAGRASHAAHLFTEHVFGRDRAERWSPGWRAESQRRMVEALAPTGPGRLEPVDARTDLGLDEFFHDYVRRRRPVIFKGAAAGWTCCRRWTLDDLAERFGAYPATIPVNDGLVDPNAPQSFEELTLAEYVDHVKSGGRKYLKFCQLLMDRPEVVRELDADWLRARRGPGTFLEELQLFIGGAGTHTPVHCALPANLFVQIHGRKYWRLYPTQAFPVIDPPAARVIYFYSDLDTRAYDPERYPAFAYLDGYELTLEPGDVLFNPTYMWHCVTNLSDSIGVGYRFSSPLRALRASFTLTLLNLMATDPFLPQAIYFSRIKKSKTIHVPKEKRRLAAARGAEGERAA